jgi:glucokinase
MSEWFAGVDVGGTNIKLGIVDATGRVVARRQFATCQERGPADAVDRIAAQLIGMCAEAGVEWSRVGAVGLGTPGTMDIPAGRILAPPNLPAWRDFPIRDRLRDACGVTVAFTNDANAAALGEYWQGRGREFSSLAFLTLGTGVGGGIILDGRPIEGAHSYAAELGHMTIDTSPAARRCGCGRPGHLEAYASATALVARYADTAALTGGVSRGAADEAADRPTTARGIAEAAERGDALARQVVEETADYLAAAVALVAHVVDPQAVLLGGAMNFGGNDSPLGRSFLARLRERTARHLPPVMAASLVIDFAALGSEAGWIGAARLAMIGNLAEL